MILSTTFVCIFLQVTEEDRNRIQELSTGQFGNEYYETERRLRLTASLFGKVIKRRALTPSLSFACKQTVSFLKLVNMELPKRV